MSASEKGRVVGVDYTELSGEALRGVIEEFISRESTDYGAVEKTFEQKIADVRRQLERGEARIVFDPAAESIHLVVAFR